MAAPDKHRIVLLVDDDVLVRNLIRRSLESAGFSVLSASDATEALALSRECPERIDVLLADIEMPGIDGITLAEQIKRERRDVAVLFMSGGTTRTVPERMTFIPKPFAPTELVAKVAGLLSQSGKSGFE